MVLDSHIMSIRVRETTMEPAFFQQDVTDEELAADLATLRAEQHPHWRLAAHTEYRATQQHQGRRMLCDFKRLWLDHRAGRHIVITLRRLPGASTWQRVAIPGADDDP